MTEDDLCMRDQIVLDGADVETVVLSWRGGEESIEVVQAYIRVGNAVRQWRRGLR